MKKKKEEEKEEERERRKVNYNLFTYDLTDI